MGKGWFSSGGVFSEQTGPHEAKMVSLEPQSIPGDIWILIFENIVFIWNKWNFDKWLFLSGVVFSEQAGPHEAKMISLEPQSIPGGDLNITI